MRMKMRRCLVWVIIAVLVLSVSSTVFTSLTVSETELYQNTTTKAEPDMDVLDLESGSMEYPFKEEYPSVEDLYYWYGELEDEHPELIEKHDYGESYEGRDLYAWEITADEDTVVEEKPTVLIDGALHAREWSTVPVASYFTWRLLDEYETNETINWVVNNRRIFVVPMTNPDGYIYDGDGVLEEREYWRKNRNDSTPTDAVGVDLNRNWDIHWEEGVDDPSSDIYHGEAPFSEPETYHLKEFMLENEIDSYQNLHSHWGTLLIPSTNMTEPTPHDDWYRGTAEHMTSLTTMLGEDEQYSYGQGHEEIGYGSAGSAIDWVYDEIGAQSYLFEIYTGEWEDSREGFYPPKEDIMTINEDLDDSLIYQTRVADTDLGDGEDLEYPPVPYLVYGTVEDEDDEPLAGIEVEVENRETGETISVETDGKGYYELNLADLIDQGYEVGDTLSIQIDPGTTMMNFDVDENWGQRIDLEYTEDAQVTTEGFSNLTIDSVEFEGRVGLGDVDLVEGYFQYRVEDEESWQESEREVIEEDGTYEIVIDDLEPDEIYDFRAAIEWNEEGEDFGRIMNFETEVYDLILESSVGGEVIKPGEGEFEYLYGSEVTIEASAEEGYYFVEWIGDVEKIEATESLETTVDITDDLEITALFQTGEGTEENPYLIENVHHLQNMEDDLEAYYELADEIDASETEEWNHGRGFDPIGDYSAWIPFKGTFDGNGYEISNLHIDRPNKNYVGMFEFTDDTSVITDVDMVDANVIGNYYVGGLAGGIGGTVRDSYFMGNVKGEEIVGGLAGGTFGTYHSSGKIEDSHSSGEIRGENSVGGLVGLNGGHYEPGEIEGSSSSATVVATDQGAGGMVALNIPGSTVKNSYATGEVTAKEGGAGGLIASNNEGTISESYATGDVSGEGTIGGLAAQNLEGIVGESDGLIERSYSTGDVTSEDEWSGGLVAVNSATISDSYATGDVIGDEKVGGLVGQVGYFFERQNRELEGEVIDSYSVGEVYGDDNQTVGGLVGDLKYGEVTDSFWDVETSGQDESDGGTGLPTAEMVRRETFTDVGWNFEGDWDMIEEQTYPFLQWQEEDTFPYAPLPLFEIDIIDYDESVEENEEVTIDYMVINKGKAEDTQDIDFYVDDSLVATEKDITLSEGEIYEGNFTWKSEEKGECYLEVISDHDEKGVYITVLEEAYFKVEIVSYDEKIEENQVLVVEYEIENTGEAEDMQDIEFHVGDNLIDTEEELSLEGGEIHEAEFVWETEEGEAGDYELEVASEDDSQVVAVTVEKDEEDMINRIRDIPGFTPIILLLAVIIAVAVNRKKEHH